MKKTILYTIAIPIGIATGKYLPSLYVAILKYFLPFFGIVDSLSPYLIDIFTGIQVVGVTAMIVPSHKVLFGSIALSITLLSAIYIFNTYGYISFLFLISEGVVLWGMIKEELENKKQLEL